MKHVLIPSEQAKNMKQSDLPPFQSGVSEHSLFSEQATEAGPSVETPPVRQLLRMTKENFWRKAEELCKQNEKEFTLAVGHIDDLDFTIPQDLPDRVLFKSFIFDNTVYIRTRPSGTHNAITGSFSHRISKGITASNSELSDVIHIGGGGSDQPILVRIRCGSMQDVVPDSELNAFKQLRGSQKGPALVVETAVSEPLEHALAKASAYLNDHTDIQCVIVARVDTLVGANLPESGAGPLGRLRIWVLGRRAATDDDQVKKLRELSKSNSLPRRDPSLCRMVDTSSLDDEEHLPSAEELAELFDFDVLHFIELIEGQDYTETTFALRMSQLFARSPAMLALIQEDEVIIDLSMVIGDIFATYRDEYLSRTKVARRKH